MTDTRNELPIDDLYTPEPTPVPAFEIPRDVDSWGAAGLVADRAATIVKGSGESVTAEFSGTPMNGGAGDTTEIVHMRWHYERLLYQLRHGIIRIEDIPSW